MPCAARGETGERVRDKRDMLLPSWKQTNGKAIESGLSVAAVARQDLAAFPSSSPFISSLLHLPRRRVFSLQIIAKALIKCVCVVFSPAQPEGRMETCLLATQRHGR